MADPSVMAKATSGSVPVPDPTVLTTQQLVQRIADLKELVEVKLGGEMSTIRARLDGMDQAIKMRYDVVEQFPRVIEEKVAHLQRLHEERFNSIRTQFEERDTRSEQAAQAGTKAIDAAFSAQKEAVGEQNRSNAAAIAKSEAQVKEQIASLGNLFKTTTDAATDKIDDVRTRLTSLESHRKGGSDTIGYILGGIGGLVGILGIIAAVVAFADKGTPQVIYQSPPPSAAGQSSIVTPIVPQR